MKKILVGSLLSVLGVMQVASVAAQGLSADPQYGYPTYDGIPIDNSYNTTPPPAPTIHHTYLPPPAVTPAPVDSFVPSTPSNSYQYTAPPVESSPSYNAPILCPMPIVLSPESYTAITNIDQEMATVRAAALSPDGRAAMYKQVSNLPVLKQQVAIAQMMNDYITQLSGLAQRRNQLVCDAGTEHPTTSTPPSSTSASRNSSKPGCSKLKGTARRQCIKDARASCGKHYPEGGAALTVCLRTAILPSAGLSQ